MAAHTYNPVKIKKSGGEVRLKISCPNYPQAISGVTWEFPAPETSAINQHIFTTEESESILGIPDAIDQHLFFVDGSVLHLSDNTPSQYQVQIEITQDGIQLDLILQPPDGPGQISNTNVTISYRFQLQAS